MLAFIVMNCISIGHQYFPSISAEGRVYPEMMPLVSEEAASAEGAG